jgi:hypothetical protein
MGLCQNGSARCQCVSGESLTLERRVAIVRGLIAKASGQTTTEAEQQLMLEIEPPLPAISPGWIRHIAPRHRAHIQSLNIGSLQLPTAQWQAPVNDPRPSA